MCTDVGVSPWARTGVFKVFCWARFSGGNEKCSVTLSSLESCCVSVPGVPRTVSSVLDA